MTQPALAFYDSYGGIPVQRLDLSIPQLGLWVADVSMVTSQPAPPTGTLIHGNLMLRGAVYRSASFGGVTSARLVGGFGGWSKPVAARGYSLPFGIMLSLVLGDVALEVGEQIAVLSDTSLGPFWNRRAGSAGSALRAVAGSSWWVNGAGIVQVGQRPSTAVTSAWQTDDWDGGAGILTIATEDPASWQPGATFSSATVQPAQTVSFVRHTVENGIGRMRVMVTP
jgi:hypothetical protein